MKSRTVTCITAMTLFAALPIPVGLAAQEQRQEQKKAHTRYKLVVIGTFGGPTSLFFPVGARTLSNRGALVGQADTAFPTRILQTSTRTWVKTPSFSTPSSGRTAR